MSELPWLSIAEVGALYRRAEISPVEYVDALIDHIETYDARYHAFLTFTPELARASAKAVEEEFRAGEWRGPLHGIPYGLKDIIDHAGVPTTANSRLLIGNVPSVDATVTARLRAAGAILMGKLTSHEFAVGGPSFDLPWPPARNPWGSDYFTGGSSSGSGAATAAGFVPFALGTDTGGSIRSPASLCGVVGLKPTHGLVSRRGIVPLSFSLDAVGPLTRTVRDSAFVLDAIAGRDGVAPNTADHPTRHLGPFRTDISRIRVGVIRNFYADDLGVHPDVSAATEAAARLFADLGATVSELVLAPLERYAACHRVILFTEAYALHRRWLAERPEAYGQIARERLLTGAFIGGADYVNATRIRRQLRLGIDEAMRDVDVALTVNAFDPPCRISDRAQIDYTFRRQARTPFSLSGNPALSMPAGFTADGLPLAIQLIGHRFEESALLAVAAVYESLVRLADQRPQLTRI